MIESGFDIIDRPHEQYVRSLRNYVFESPTSDANWNYCCEHWMRHDALKWLEEQAVMIKARAVKRSYQFDKRL